MFVAALLVTLALDPPAVPAALPACIPTLRVPAPWPYTWWPAELRNSHLLVSRGLGGFGFGSPTGVLDTNTGAVVWFPPPAFTLGSDLATFLDDDTVVFATMTGPNLYQMHAHWFGPDGQPGTADDATWMFESGVGFTSLPDGNDDEVAWIVTKPGGVELHRCDSRPGTSTPCFPGGPAVFLLPFGPGVVMDAHPVGGSNMLLDRYNSNVLTWVDPQGVTSPWQFRYFTDSLGPFVAVWWSFAGGTTSIEPATQPASAPWWLLPYRDVKLSRAFGSNGGARAVGRVSGATGPAVVIDLGLGTYATTTTSYPWSWSIHIDGDQVAYLENSITGFYDVVVEHCIFP